MPPLAHGQIVDRQSFTALRRGRAECPETCGDVSGHTRERDRGSLPYPGAAFGAPRGVEPPEVSPIGRNLDDRLDLDRAIDEAPALETARRREQPEKAVQALLARPESGEPP